MTEAFQALLLVALLLSTLGYVSFFRSFCAIPKYASYIFTLSLIALTMYFAGLLGILRLAAYAVFGLGYLFYIPVIVTHRFHIAFRRPLLTMTKTIFVVWFVLTCVTLMQYRLIDYDNFSHWALVVKQMLITDAFPNATSALIDFKNYPLGASSFIYYVCRIAGHSDGLMLTAQGMLILACFYAMFGVIRDDKRFLLATLLGLVCAIISFFNISIRINNLLVDYLLPLCALAAIAGMIENAKDYRLACITSLPLLGFLLIIKSTGLFFAIPCYLYLFYNICGHCRRKPLSAKALLWLSGVAVTALSILPLLLWNVHTARVFAGAQMKFPIDLQSLTSLDLNQLSALVTDKTQAQILSIVQQFFRSIMSLDQLTTQGLLLMNLLALVAWLNARFGFCMRWKLLRVLILMDLLMVVYYAGLLVFYIVSMPLDEALRLAGFERYAASMMLYIIGVLGICAVRDVERSLYIQQGEARDYKAFKSLKTKRIYQYATLVTFAFAILLLVTDINGMNTLQKAYPDTLPGHSSAVLGDHWNLGDQSDTLLYAPDTNSQVSNNYLRYIGRYLLMNPNVDTVSIADDALLANIQNHDTFAIVESDPAIQAWMLVQTGLPGDVGIYDVQQVFGNLSLAW